MSSAFNAAALESDYAFLDNCPEHLFGDIVTCPVGTLAERVAGLLRWRNALLAGQLPSAYGWPPAELSKPVLRALDEMGIARFCKDQPELVDALLKDILDSFAKQSDALRSEVPRRLRELEELERKRLADLEKALADKEKRKPKPVRMDDALMRRLRAQAEQEAAGKERGSDSRLAGIWGERARAWADIADVFGDLGDMMGRGWDLARSILRHLGWQDVVRLQKLLAELPQLREIIRSLGRLQESSQEASVAEKILIPVRRLEEERREVRTPHMPSEMRGVERSGEISRMLPVEAAMLGHPTLRFVWHARRAERALMTYRVEGVEIERIQVERETTEEEKGKRPRLERGPVLAVIDTSGSMDGLPEQVAKAIVLEAVRTAHAEKRRCFLYAYSGPGQELRHELNLEHDGIGRLLEFLSQSFGGGTDIGAMHTVVEQLGQRGWEKADVLLVTDGEWSAPGDVVDAVRRAKERGTRFHGVQVGNRGRTGLHDICEPVHVFRDWVAVGGG